MPINFRPMRKAALMLFFLCGISAFYAAAEPAATNSPQYEMRTFKVDPNIFWSGLKEATSVTNGDTNQARDVSSLAKNFFQKLGVNMDPPKTLFFNDRLGVLFVYATPKDLEVIERAIQVLDYTPPQVHIKVRFMELPKDFLTRNKNSLPAGMTNGIGLLTSPETGAFLHDVQLQNGFEELGEPEATTRTGREMRAYVMNPLSTTFDRGLFLKAIPNVLSDGYTIDLQTSAPQMSGASVTRNLYDSQTLVLFPVPDTSVTGAKKYRDKMLVALVTVNLIDEAGNRLHEDDQMPFAQTSFPMQPFVP